MQYIEKIGYKTSAGIKAKVESMEYYPFHLHDDAIEIICVLNGTVKISDSAASYTIKYGDVHIFNKNDPHKIESDDPDNILLTIQIDCPHYMRHFDELDDAYFICDTYAERDLYAVDIKHLRFQLARIYREYSGHYSDILLEDMAKELLRLLLSQFRQYVYKSDKNRAANIVRLQNIDHIYKNYERMYRIVDFVYTNFRKKLYLKDIAEREFLSEEHISRDLKETLGLSFTQLISLTRCEEAARQLSSTKRTVDQIAQDVGFANRKHLASQFKRWYQQTPSEYRTSILKDLSSDSKVRLRPFDYDYANILLEMYLDEG
ncbi:MAG: helix-turn-helix transcriptional regulator [Firmicutes bacterium]|nr:helix-turn-helix transcriptional regulator [Bacillota bacterium]